MTPIASATKEDTQMAGSTSNGEAELYFWRKMDIMVGTSWMEAVFMTVKITMLLLATVGVLFALFISFMAEIPSGVAALLSPKRFAVMFMQMAWMAGLSSGYSLNSCLITGLKSRVSTVVRPPLLAISRSPVQRLIMPAIEMTRPMASEAPVKMASESGFTFPVKTAQTMLIRISAPQI